MRGGKNKCRQRLKSDTTALTRNNDMIRSINELIEEHRRRYTAMLNHPMFANNVLAQLTPEQFDKTNTWAEKIQADFLLVIARSLKQVNAITDPRLAYEKVKSRLILDSMREDVEQWRQLRVNQNNLLCWLRFTLPIALKLWKEAGGQNK